MTRRLGLLSAAFVFLVAVPSVSAATPAATFYAHAHVVDARENDVLYALSDSLGTLSSTRKSTAVAVVAYRQAGQLQALAKHELVWLSTHPADACYGTLFAAWKTAQDKLVAGTTAARRWTHVWPKGSKADFRLMTANLNAARTWLNRAGHLIPGSC